MKRIRRIDGHASRFSLFLEYLRWLSDSGTEHAHPARVFRHATLTERPRCHETIRTRNNVGRLVRAQCNLSGDPASSAIHDESLPSHDSASQPQGCDEANLGFLDPWVNTRGSSHTDPSPVADPIRLWTPPPRGVLALARQTRTTSTTPGTLARAFITLRSWFTSLARNVNTFSALPSSLARQFASRRLIL
jgi:hypothetical protein